MKVQELIDTLKNMNPEAEVKLAIQPAWAFQHEIDEAVEVPADVDGLQWGVNIRYLTDMKVYEEFCEGEANTRLAAFNLYLDLTSPHGRMEENGIESVEIAAIHNGNLITEAEADELADNKTPIVYLSDGGQECYLPESVSETLGWTRSNR
jgi:hypothetical protein